MLRSAVRLRLKANWRLKAQRLRAHRASNTTATTTMTTSSRQTPASMDSVVALVLMLLA